MLSLSNQATLIGQVTTTPELVQDENGEAVLRFALTTTTTWSGDDQVRSRTEEHPVEIRNVFARRLYGSLARDHAVLCEGAVRSRTLEGVRSVFIAGELASDLGPSSSGVRPSRNGVVLHGNVGGAPELKAAGGTSLLTFRLATKAHGEDETEWHTVKVWGSRAESLERILAAGYRLAVAGELRHERYLDSQGRAQHVAAIHAHEVQLVERPR